MLRTGEMVYTDRPVEVKKGIPAKSEISVSNPKLGEKNEIQQVFVNLRRRIPACDFCGRAGRAQHRHRTGVSNTEERHDQAIRRRTQGQSRLAQTAKGPADVICFASGGGRAYRLLYRGAISINPPSPMPPMRRSTTRLSPPTWRNAPQPTSRRCPK